VITSASLTKISIEKDKAGFDKASANKELAQVDANQQSHE
jgi:hypothetical protein